VRRHNLIGADLVDVDRRIADAVHGAPPLTEEACALIRTLLRVTSDNKT
jgi:hypothetical protein